MLSNRKYLGYTFTFVFVFGAMFAYVSASPFVLQNVLGLSALTYSITFGINALGMVLTSALAMKLAGRMDTHKILGGDVIALLLSTAALLVDIFIGVNMMSTLVLLFAVLASFGFIFGHSTALALGHVTAYTGTESAFLARSDSFSGPLHLPWWVWSENVTPAPWALPWSSSPYSQRHASSS